MTDPFTQDPVFDPEFAPSTADFHFRSHGAMLNGVILTAGGAGPKPTVLLLHGFPGNERNFDLAQIYRRAGFNAVVFHYRGAWGSQGSFSFENCLEDLPPALEFLCQNAARYQIDPGRIALVGHSMGGWIALMGTARGLGVRAAVSICGFNFGRFTRRVLDNPDSVRQWAEAFEGEVLPLAGTSGQALIEEMLHHGEAWDLLGQAPRLAQTPILLVGATQDTIATLELSHHPLAEALPHARQVLYETDHSLASHRVALARDTLDFLWEALSTG